MMRARGVRFFCLAALQVGALLLAAGCQRSLPVVGADASVKRPGPASPTDTVTGKALASMTTFGSSKLHGSASFSQDGVGTVAAGFYITDCTDGDKLMFSIREGKGCSSDAEIGKAWSQHEGTKAVCESERAFTAASRRATVGKRASWSVGGSTDTDVTGRAVVVLMDGNPAFQACGVIKARTP